ncbi:MAG: urea amidohydrolase [Pseudonocardiaceae bacterium]|nr:urea amidohydrolase [Pseudonocardiaceae bacterium]
MHITPREQERLTLFAAAELARKRRARGALLGATEATALVCDEILEMAWDGVPLDEVIAAARRVVGPDELLPDVPTAVPRIEVEALFPHGSSLVHVEAPFGSPGTAVVSGSGDIELAPDHPRREIRVRNTGRRQIWLSSHFPLDQVNAALEVELGAAEAARYRLDIPAGTALNFPPGEQRTVTVVETGGDP